MIRHIIFDWSGTLVDDLPLVWKASNHVFRLAEVPELSLDEFRREFCLPFKLFYDRYIPHVALEKLEEWYHGHLKGLPEGVMELPYAREFLEFCRERELGTYLLSSVHRDHFALQVMESDLGRFLDYCYVEARDKREVILRLLRRHGLKPEETLFVGDMQHDIDAARAGGVVSCAVLTGYNKLEQLRASFPDLIVEHLGELKRLLGDNALSIAGERNCRPTV